MTEQHMEARPPVQVRALVCGAQREVWLFGWRADRGYLRYRTDAGTHPRVGAAADVERLT